MVAISSPRISNPSVPGDGRHLCAPSLPANYTTYRVR